MVAGESSSRKSEYDLFLLYLNDRLSCDDQDFFDLVNAYESEVMIVVIPPQTFTTPKGLARFRALSVLRLATSSFKRSHRQWQAQGRDIFRSVRPVRDLWARLEVYQAFLAYLTEDLETTTPCSCVAAMLQTCWLLG